MNATVAISSSRSSQFVLTSVALNALNATNFTLFGSGNVNLNSAQATFMTLTNIDSSTVMKPRDIQIGARVTF